MIDPALPGDAPAAVPAPARRLRLSAILIELGATAYPTVIEPPDETGEASGKVEPSAVEGGARGGRRRRRRRRLRLRRKPIVRSNLTVGEIVDRTAHAGFGFIAAFLALIALVPGVGNFIGLVVALLGAQMAAGLSRPWLPRIVRGHVVTMVTLDWISQKLATWTGGMETLIKPRLPMLCRGVFWPLIGVCLAAQGIGLSLPLVIPALNLPFILAILLYAVGLLEDDGVLIAIGHVLTASYAVAVVASWHLVAKALLGSWTWLMSWI